MVDYNTLQRKRNMVVGIFVVMSIIAFVWMVFVFGELPLLVTRHKSFNVYAQFPSAPGIQKNTPVKYCGYQIGKVFKVDAPASVIHGKTGKPSNQVKISMAIENKFMNLIPNNIQIRVMKRNIGSSYINLIDMPGDPTGRINVKTKVLQGDSGFSTEFIPKELQKKIDLLMDNMTVVAKDLHKIIGDEENRNNVKLAISSLTKAIDQADVTLKAVQGFTESGQNSLDNVAGELNLTLKEIRCAMETINDGAGTVGRLINDPALHESLLDVSSELEMTIDQIKKLIVETRQQGIKISF